MHRFLGWCIVSLEVLWCIGWLIAMVFGHALSSDPALEYRQAIFFLMFHAVFNFPPLLHLINHRSRSKTKYWLPMLAFLCFGACSDVNSLVETIVHLPQSNSLWYAMITLSSVGLFDSIVTILWFLSMETSDKRERLLQ